MNVLTYSPHPNVESWAKTNGVALMDSSTILIDDLADIAKQSPISDRQNQRGNPRFPFTRPVVLQALDKYADRVGPIVKSQGRNICLWGICVVSPVEFTSGDFIVVSLEPREGAETIELLAEIRHTISQEDGHQVIGCKFLEAISAPGF